MSSFCLPGCGGNVNNYLNLEECTSVALRGACCYRTFSTDIDDVTRSTQQLEVKCQVAIMNIMECKDLEKHTLVFLTAVSVIFYNLSHSHHDQGPTLSSVIKTILTVLNAVTFFSK